MFPEYNTIVAVSLSGVYTYDMEYTLPEDDIFVDKPVSKLLGNYPNPFNPETNIRFNVEKPGEVVIDVFNIRGQKIQTVFDGYLDKGTHSVIWDGKEAGSGVYFYRMQMGDYSETKRMVLMK